MGQLCTASLTTDAMSDPSRLDDIASPRAQPFQQDEGCFDIERLFGLSRVKVIAKLNREWGQITHFI